MSDPHLDELWQRVLDAWDDDAAHAAFLEHGRGTKQLGACAARYREELRRASAYREDQTRVETAQKRLNGIAMLAMVDLDATGTTPETARMQAMTRTLRFAAGVMFFGIIVFTVARFLTK